MYGFEYEIIDDEVTITSYQDITIKSINIPEMIGGIRISNINSYAFLYCYNLTVINNIELKEGINVINNRFIYYNGWIYKIINQICDDYCCNYDRYFIYGNRFDENLKTY